MIRKLEDNDVVKAIQLMDTSTQQNNYEPYARNELYWIQHLTTHIEEQKANDPRFIAIGDYDKETLKGFMLASAFKCYYTQEWVMDVKDCIVNNNYNNVFVVTRLFNYMIAHIKEHGGKHWRADSIRANDKSIEYTEFLKKKYNAIPFHGVHGMVN